MLGKLNETEIHNLLSSQVIGRLACINREQPYIIPITYAYDGIFIYCQTNVGMKLDILRRNPNVCFEVDNMTDMRNWQSVVVQGKFMELSGELADTAREVFFKHIYTLKTSSTVHKHEHENTDNMIDDSTRLKDIMFRIKIEKLSGRFEDQ